MSDIKLDEDFERYVIGFTENHFIPSGEFSPTPSEHAIGYNTFATDFAEKSNRGELKILHDHSVHLDKQKRHSVSKIHTNILDLLSELSERRKVATPLLSKSAMELHRPDSRFSNHSDTSFKSSSSLPLIEVQQLPPVMRSNRSFPSLDSGVSGLPDIGANLNDSINAKMKKSDKKQSKNQSVKSTSSSKQQDSQGRTKFETVVMELMKKKKANKVSEEKKTLDENKQKSQTDTDEHDSRSVRFKVGGDTLEQGANSDGTENAVTHDPPNKWKIMYEKLRDAMAQVRERGDSFHAYKGRYFSNDSKARKMSYCQSSYKERAERERMQNIRRRHSSQTNIGPIDFNKLRRQITIGKSKTMYN